MMEGKRFEDIFQRIIFIQLFLTSGCVGSSPCMSESDRLGRYTVRGVSGNIWLEGVPSGSRVQVSVSCNVGAIAQQSVTSQCSNGTWIPPWPRCEKPCSVPINRGEVLQFVNGDATRPITSYYTPSTLPDGTLLVARCRDPENYIFIGDQRRTCEGGQWTGEEPQCRQKPPCSVPINIGEVRQFVNGDATRPITSYYTHLTLPDGTQLVARCRDPGKHRLVGDQRRTCQGGQWTGEEPECQRVQTQVLFYQEDNKWREVASNGTFVVYVQRGNPRRLDVVCRVTSLSLRPPQLTTPLVNDDDVWHWHWLRSHGIRLDPISTDFSGMYTCNGSSSFHSVHVLFKAAECGAPAAPVHGRILDGFRQQPRDIFPSGTSVSFECEDDYRLVGSRRITCEKGQWSDDPPVCIEPPYEAYPPSQPAAESDSVDYFSFLSHAVDDPAGLIVNGSIGDTDNSPPPPIYNP